MGRSKSPRPFVFGLAPWQCGIRGGVTGSVIQEQPRFWVFGELPRIGEVQRVPIPTIPLTTKALSITRCSTTGGEKALTIRMPCIRLGTN